MVINLHDILHDIYKTPCTLHVSVEQVYKLDPRF